MKLLILNTSPVKDGATAEIMKIAAHNLSSKYEVKCLSISDFDFSFCKGCRSCHNTAKCVMNDGAQLLMAEFEAAQIILCVSPSYWADVPGQFKAFIDRCTPWCNTHEPHAKLTSGKKGYAIVQRTGPNMKECERLIETIEHFYGHLEIEKCGHTGFTGIEGREDVEKIRKEIEKFCNQI